MAEERLSTEATLPAALRKERLARGQAVGRYVILEPLGEGGMGVVYSAFDPDLDRRVALKLVVARAQAGGEARARLLREAQAMARLSHPNVITVFDVGVVGDQVFLAMEQVVGATLDGWLAAEPRSWQLVRDVMVDAGRGLVAAHAAGLVHRDVKPHNILVGDDGRVRVADFGLARALGDPETHAPPGRSPDLSSLHTPLTQEGALVGTPRYMAPEQLRGEDTDERADQFAFCAVFFEALYRQPPYAGDTLRALLAEMDAGRLRPGDARVPAWLHQAIARGLAAAPDARHPSMTALLDALERDRRAPARKLFAATAALAALTAAGIAWSTHTAASPCAASARRLVGVWDPGRAREVERAFAAVDKPYARATLAGVTRALDEQANAWVTMARDACEATEVRREQPAAMMELRLGCLEERREELRALVELMTHADEALLRNALPAAQALTPVARCGDLKALAGPLPEPPAARPRVREAQRSLAAAGALLAAGRFAEGKRDVDGVVAAAEQIGHPPLLADALVLRGRFEDRLGDYAAAERSLSRGLAAAEAGRHDLARARAWVHLVQVAGVRLERRADGHRFAEWAAGVLTRIGGEPELEARRLDNLALVLREEGKYAEALALHAQAHAIWVRLHGPNHREVAGSLGLLGVAARLAGKLAEGRAHGERALAILEGVLGPDHPDVANARISLGNSCRALGQREEALLHYRRALAVREAALGPEHADVAGALSNVALLLGELGERGEARGHFERAMAIQERALGANSTVLATTVNNLGRLEQRDGKPEAALAAYQRAHDIWLRALGPEHPDVALARRNLGDALAELGRDAEALPHYQAALAINEKVRGADSAYVADVLIRLGRSLERVGRRAEAVAAARRAVAIVQRAGPENNDLVDDVLDLARRLAGRGYSPPLEEEIYLLATAVGATARTIGAAGLLAAEALWAAGKRERSLSTAEQALARAGAEAPELDAWLRSRRPPP